MKRKYTVSFHIKQLNLFSIEIEMFLVFSQKPAKFNSFILHLNSMKIRDV